MKPVPEADDAPVKICTCVTASQWKICKKNRWGWRRVMDAGIGVLTAEGSFGERIRILEAQLDAMRRQKIERDRTILRLSGRHSRIENED